MNRHSYNASILFSHRAPPGLPLTYSSPFFTFYIDEVWISVGSICPLSVGPNYQFAVWLNQQGGQWLIFTLLWYLLVWTFLNI